MANYKHGTKERNIWRKLHIGVTDDGNIVAGEVTMLRDSDIATVPKLLEQVTTDIMAVIDDGAYYKKRMEDYIKQNQNCEKAKFIDPLKDGSKNYGSDHCNWYFEYAEGSTNAYYLKAQDGGYGWGNKNYLCYHCSQGDFIFGTPPTTAYISTKSMTCASSIQQNLIGNEIKYDIQGTLVI